MGKRLRAGDKAPNFQFETPWRSSQGFYETTQGQDAVLVFLRYHGCPVCQMEMANFKREIALFKKKNARIFVFLQSSRTTLLPLLNDEDWPFEIVCDPEGKFFELYSVGTGNLFQYLHPAALVAACKATCRGFMHRKFEGKETQLPAAFIVKSDKTIKYLHYGQNVSDVPRPSALAENLD